MMIVTIDTKAELESTMECALEFIINNIDNPNYVDDWLKPDFYRRIFSERYGTFKTFIAINRVETMGFIVGSNSTHYGTYEIRQHYVKDMYRRVGVATRLKTRLVDYAKQRGNFLITSDVAKDNIASIGLNEKMGWSKTELDEDTYRFMKML
jgi:ribosomal protein S18 acetylase RimI-like enzyme